jgi:hypothetical protein
MRIGIFESSTGSGPHVAQLTRGLRALDHHVEAYQRGQGYDLVIVHNQVAHRTDYEYPHFPDERIPMAFVDFAEYGYWTRLPENQRAFANSFTPSAMGHDTKSRHEQIRLKSYIEGRSFPYLLREKFKAIDYPASYCPVDYPLYHLSVHDTPPNRENYLARDLDLFCHWGHSHPWRVPIAEALGNAHVKAEIGNRWQGQDAYNAPYNYPQDYYFSRMLAAKCCPSFDGYGSGSFRMTEALCRTLLLQGPLTIETRAPLVDGVHCRCYDVEHEGEEFKGTNIADVLCEALHDTVSSFTIYEQGFDHVHTHLTEKATAAYLLEVVERHDWSKPTPLEVE